VQEGKGYAILTAEIARATFGVTPGAHKQLKGLGAVKTGNNLRDHMTDLELIFTMLGEASTTEIARKHDAHGLTPNRDATHPGELSRAGHLASARKHEYGALGAAARPRNDMRNHLATLCRPTYA
jgi:hypothetical protein